MESRIGAGLVLSLAVKAGDTREKAAKLAAHIVKLKLWPEMFDPEKLWSSSVVDNGFEVLVLCQQNLYANLAPVVPNQQGLLGNSEAKVLFEAFVAQLRKEYQEEMIVAAPFETANMRVEATQDGPGMFELDTSVVGAKPGSPASQTLKPLTPAAELLPEVGAVGAALLRLSSMDGAKATLEACRIYRVLSMKKFHAALGAASQAEADRFARHLDAAAGSFTQKQQESIMAWTNLTITAMPAEEGDDDAAPPEEPPTRSMIKQEMHEAHPAQRRRPDWTGRAAPNTPADGGRARYGAQTPPWGLMSYKAGGKKGGGKGKWGGPRSYGIASLDESARLHGSRGGYEFGQLSALPDAHMKVGSVKREEEELNDGKRKGQALGAGLKRPKGTPTVAPLCPAQAEDDDDVWEDL